MLLGLARLQEGLADPATDALAGGLMATLLQAGRRSRGSLLLVAPGKQMLEAREVVPPGEDPLNSPTSSSSGSAAYWLGQGEAPRLIADLRAEVFFESVPVAAEELVSCLLAPVACDGARFGCLVVYATTEERPFDSVELAFWGAAGRSLGLALHWRALRKKLTAQANPAGATTPA
jgi:GAF domain-containing protein